MEERVFWRLHETHRYNFGYSDWPEKKNNVLLRWTVQTVALDQNC